MDAWIKPKFEHSDELNVGQKTADFRTKELKEKGKKKPQPYPSYPLKQSTNVNSLYRAFSVQLNDFLTWEKSDLLEVCK